MRSLIIIVTTLMAAHSFASDISLDQSLVMTKVQINGNSTDYRGIIDLNFPENKIELKIYNDPCDTLLADNGVIKCQAMPTLVRTMKVPVLTKEDSCGSQIYEGSGLLDNGSKVVISVADHSTRRCMDLQPAPVMVGAEVQEARSNLTTTYWLE